MMMTMMEAEHWAYGFFGICTGCHGAGTRMKQTMNGWDERYQESSAVSEPAICWRCDGTGRAEV